ncbi:tRNA methyltransferase complex GCD14 subunit [Carpediemonas membranifera]|uniref:tRNA (adenine(58)-N(1))-methyltransferase n=1 Tax=Carpediemonas membranifera TaxID=201153 RepID=A0A8J6B353_9EUKA|nr:tRNA methyltransferase complex GCD14 subunit [Carpediemonas membranifera]|eukprot:KAG9397335.1 tRNA methyltransferase complex GCD14 subunit [Carpediemonas membranifera]
MEGETIETIQFGDNVIIYEGVNRVFVHKIVEHERYDSKFGTFYNCDFVGKRYGQPIFDNKDRNHIYALKFNSLLWTLALEKRTQVLYLPDIAHIIAQLNIRAGDTVVEAGTGSGSLSHALAEAVGPTGRLVTFEFHEVRAAAAKEEFADHGLKNVTSLHRDVLTGFHVDDAAVVCDALFLDVPAPWSVIEHVAESLRPGKMFCSFSPCIEQVQRTVAAAAKAGFTDIVTHTVDVISYDRRSRPVFDIVTQTINQLQTGGKIVESRLAKRDDEESKAKAAEVAESRERAIAAMEQLIPVLPRGVTSQCIPMKEQQTHKGYLSFMRAPIPFEGVEIDVEVTTFMKGGKRKGRGRGRGKR